MAFQELRLTSPHMRGPNVKHAQESLNHNRYSGENGFYKGKLDGVYGPETAGATKAAKWKLGYSKHDVSPRGGGQHYDAKLDDFLNNRHDIGFLMKRRRASRIHHESTSGNVKVKALEIGLKEVGYHEGGGDCTPYGEFYGLHCGPWCAMFFTWCASKAGSKIFHPGFFSYCPNLTAAALHGDHGLRMTSSPEKGDAVLYQFDSDSAADHVERFIDWTNASHTDFRALGGNTDGGYVRVQTRSRSSVQHFVSVPE